jgi:bidirectional [NiFe] hydrogenase diaphorase subunit
MTTVYGQCTVNGTSGMHGAIALTRARTERILASPMDVRVTVDGRTITAGMHEMLLGVLVRSGIRLPTLCHLEGLRPYGACRLCLVEIHREGRVRTATACDLPVEEGGVYVTSSPRLERLRRLVAELHLARCPDVAEVRRIARSLGVRGSRLAPLDDTCVLCGLCERVCRDVVGAVALGFEGRGTSRAVSTAYGEPGSECIGCGACSDVCPTGTIRMLDAAFERLRSLPGAERPCRHALSGIQPGALCSHGYECDTCEVDQRLRGPGGESPILAARLGRPLAGGSPR